MITRRNFLKVAAAAAMSAGLLAEFPNIAFGASQPQPGAYWGALIAGTTYGTNPATGQTYVNPPWDFAAWDMFQAHAGKKVSILHWGQPWYWSSEWPHGYYPFVPSLMDAVRSRGAIPMIDWAAWDLSANGAINQPKFSLGSIINGDHDAYLKTFAAAAKAWGFPFMIRFNWEMNGNWFPWSESVNGNSAGQYVRAWRHVHDIFTAAGATNVTWVWCANTAAKSLAPMAALYPGDAYVDWTGLDVYNLDPKVWASFGTMMTGQGAGWLANSYQELLSFAPKKPIMLGECASREAGDGGAKKAAWITDALANQIPVKFPAIKAVLWFNWNCDPGSSYIIESSQPAQAAFAAGIASPYYAANNYGKLAAGQKVKPLAALVTSTGAVSRPSAPKIKTGVPTAAGAGG